MIEIIREESWDSSYEKMQLPKNIKQIGMPDIGDRIYIENQTYQYMHPFRGTEDKAVYVMLGRFENYGGRQCTFIESAILLEEIDFEGPLPVWNDDTWAYLYRKLNHSYDEMVIVGWAMDICGELPNISGPLERMHSSYFGGAHQLLFLMDSLEREESFYGLKNGYLSRREGFYIYYDKAIPDRLNAARESLKEEEQFLSENDKEEPINYQPRQRSAYREYLESQNIKKEKNHISYTSTFFLAVVAITLVFAAVRNYEKMNLMEETLAKMNANQTVAVSETTTETSGLQVEQISGTITPIEQSSEVLSDQIIGQTIGQTTEQGIERTNGQEASGIAESVQSADKSESTQTTSMSEDAQGTDATNTANVANVTNTTEAASVTATSNPYLEQGYYIVQSGDSLVGICKKVYQTTAMLDKICEVNGLEDPDAIYEGQYLTLPN